MFQKRLSLLIGSMLLACVGTFAPARAAADAQTESAQWNQFRGPHENGFAASSVKLPAAIGEKSHVVWKTAIDGKAWSSPVVWGDQIWLTNATEDGHKMYAVCVDAASGKIVKNVLVFENEKPQFCHPANSYASSTPTIEAGRLYAHYGVHGTACIDTASGNKLWERRDLPCNHFRGAASSPILHGDKLFVQFDGYDVQYVVALNKTDGTTLWRHDRAFDFGTADGDNKKAFGTPSIIMVDGKEQLLCPAAVATEALDPLTGNVRWTVRHGGMNASAPPIYSQGLVFITNGSGQMIAVKPTGNGDVTASHVAYKCNNKVAKRSSPIVVDDLLYMVGDNGVLVCLEAATGTSVWSERLGGGEYAASPVYAGGQILICSMEGQATIFQPGRSYKLVADGKFDAGFMASPAFAGKALILRSKTSLYKLEP